MYPAPSAPEYSPSENTNQAQAWYKCTASLEALKVQLADQMKSNPNTLLDEDFFKHFVTVFLSDVNAIYNRELPTPLSTQHNAFDYQRMSNNNDKGKEWYLKVIKYAALTLAIVGVALLIPGAYYYFGTNHYFTHGGSINTEDFGRNYPNSSDLRGNNITVTYCGHEAQCDFTAFKESHCSQPIITNKMAWQTCFNDKKQEGLDFFISGIALIGGIPALFIALLGLRRLCESVMRTVHHAEINSDLSKLKSLTKEVLSSLSEDHKKIITGSLVSETQRQSYYLAGVFAEAGQLVHAEQCKRLGEGQRLNFGHIEPV